MYVKKIFQLFDNYLIARLQNRPSTALFWYLPEPPNIKTAEDLSRYQNTQHSPIYLMDYRQKLQYSLENKEGIIVLPYYPPIGPQVNPEAAFQYALGLHDQFYSTKNEAYFKKFWHYVEYFKQQQNAEGLWSYPFDWYGIKAPWYSALAQTRGASVMLRAWLLSKNNEYLNAAKNALMKFLIPTSEGGFLHPFKNTGSYYFEEYPEHPTGVINGFMAALIGIWELQYWLNEPKWINLWESGIHSLEKMLPFYTTNWWSLYDLDKASPIINVNSPRYHLLEMHYLQILSLLSHSAIIKKTCENRFEQYHQKYSHIKVLCMKTLRKILYR